MIEPTDRSWKDYLSEALMAQFLLIPEPLRPDNELIPGRDDLESGDE